MNRLWRRNPYGTRSAGPHRPACDGVKLFVQADLDSRQVIIPATERQTGRWNGWIALLNQRKNLERRHRNLCLQLGQPRWDSKRLECCSRCPEKVIGREPGAGSMCLPLMFQQPCIRIDIAVIGWIRWSRRIAAVLWVAAVRILRPKPVQHERCVPAAFRRARMRIAELWRPRKVQKVVIEVLGPGDLGPTCADVLLGRRSCIGRRRGIASDQAKKKCKNQILPHGAASITGKCMLCRCLGSAMPRILIQTAHAGSRVTR
jgi:hypothetical protein